MEQYIVKYWIPKEDGYREQREETVEVINTRKNSHNIAKLVIMGKYKLTENDVVSVMYV